MKHAHDILRARLHARAGLTPKSGPRFSLSDFESLRKSEWSPEFEEMMRNRLLMGALRYGTFAEKSKAVGKWDLLGALQKKAEMYEATGNLEYLVDAANYCLLAYLFDNHPRRHFQALDDHHDHCKRKDDGQ